MPTLVLWGEEFAVGGKMWDFRWFWREMVRDPSFLSLPQCGHLQHEEKAQEVNAALLQFLEV
jgi:haloacetate dehalogenase